MLENQTKKILLFSDDPADVSFLSEIVVTQQADLELVISASQLCSKIAQYRADHSLAAIFVDVTTASQLRKFEYELQSKMGNSISAELSSMIHYISGTPLSKHREILQSPYFSFYSERKNFDFSYSANFYQQSFYSASEYFSKTPLSFDQGSKEVCFEKLKKEMLSKNASPEWILKFKNVWSEMIEVVFPARFEFSFLFSDSTLKIVVSSEKSINKSNYNPDGLLDFGVSIIQSRQALVLIIPVLTDVSKVTEVFRFYKVEA